jgi:2-polyprenyl-3-methyl-5-hydroxy-6-metoxy-1,4-benzoquinol methylase
MDKGSDRARQGTGSRMLYTDTYDPDTDFDRWHTLATADALTAWIRPGDDVLELGCATGLMTAEIAGSGARVTAVDHDETYLQRTASRALAGVETQQGDVIRIRVHREFDHVVATNIVHEVDDVPAFLANCRRHLRPAGLLHVSLQNPASIHRLVGREMGVIADLNAVSVRGAEYHTLRMFTADELASIVERAGFRVVHREGVLLKPLPNALMAQLPEAMIRGFIRAAKHAPELASINYLVCRVGDGHAG